MYLVPKKFLKEDFPGTRLLSHKFPLTEAVSRAKANLRPHNKVSVSVLVIKMNQKKFASRCSIFSVCETGFTRPEKFS